MISLVTGKNSFDISLVTGKNSFDNSFDSRRFGVIFIILYDLDILNLALHKR